MKKLSAKEIDKEFERLPQSFLARQFSYTGINFAGKGVSVWGTFWANLLWYCVNIWACTSSEYATVRYASAGVLIIAALMFFARFFFGEKGKAERKLGYAYFVIALVAEIQLMILSAVTVFAAYIISDPFYSEQRLTVINIVYIGAALLTVAAVVMNVYCWRRTKRNIVELSYFEEDDNDEGCDEDDETFSENAYSESIRNNDKINAFLKRVGLTVLMISLAIPVLGTILSRIFDWGNSWYPLIGVTFSALMLLMFWACAHANANLIGRAYCLRKF